MKASLRSVRIAPKKASLIAKMIRGKSVPDAVSVLEHTNKKAARILEQLLRSAMANTSHNVNQDPQMMIIKTLTVNKAQSYHRGVPMARGRVRPMRKFLSHIDLTLGFAEEKDAKDAKESKDAKEKKSEKDASKTAKKPVKKTQASKSSTSTKGKSSAKKDTATSSSKSAASKKSSPNP